MAPESAIASDSTILIIDDSPDNLRVLSKTLETYGYAVRCVTNGSLAFASIQNSPPDLILLDIRMPGMNGYEICEKLKQTQEARDIPVIFLSALDDVQDIVKAFQIGGVDYITKPFQTEEVLARIKNQLMIQNLRKQLYAQNQHLLQEIDERRKSEQALYEEIQRRVLVEASLQDAKNAAEAANYVKSEFLAQISHELRTPLNIILGLTTLMQKESSLPQLHQNHLETIDENAQRLLKIINGVLSMTRAEANQLKLEEQEVDLHGLLNSMIALWHPKAIEKGLQLEFYRAPSVPQYVYSDERKLRQILMNLLENAVQTTERGHIKIKVDAEEQPALLSYDCADFQGKSYSLTIEVTDTGRTVLLGELDTVLQLFPQPDSSEETSQDLGLSLLLVRQFAQLMRGSVVLQGSPNRGSTVRVNLLVQLADSMGSTLPVGSEFHIVNSVSDSEDAIVEALQTVMPATWLEQLHQMAVKGFDQKILHLLQDIPASHAAFAKTLEIWTRNFQFERIVEVTQSIL
ncbi:ATP-binding response regulator [Leptolyngbya ohadii]|uniref:ATP-binding response regulator n=1 Tax=Leptolyngbya ohadii TaxID=1962290 RepID=UPI000B5A1215|nr:response regulator [Leptolyngbya ohadii]